MIQASPADVALLLTRVQTGAIQRDWSAVWDNEEKLEAIDENLESLIYFAAIANPFMDTATLERFIGKLTVNKIILEFIQEEGIQKDQFVTIGRSLDIAIRQMLQDSHLTSDVLKTLQQKASFDEILSDQSDADRANAVLLVLAAMMVVSDEAGLMTEEMYGCCGEDQACEEDCA